jgi:hypothetical protein
VKQIHYGLYDDEKDWEEKIHGVTTAQSMHVNDCIYGSNLNGIKYFMNEMNEQKYKQAKREPLGKSLIRNYKFPDVVKDDEFKFGLKSIGSN